jgi:hypothetical protein
MKFPIIILSAFILLGTNSNGQDALEINPRKLVIDSLATNHLRAVYFVKNKSNDTLNISVKVSFDWCLPNHQPKKLLPLQMDSVVFDCGIYNRHVASSSFTLIDDKGGSYVCGLHYSLKREVFLACCNSKGTTKIDSAAEQDIRNNIRPIPIKYEAYVKEYEKYKSSDERISKRYYANGKLALIISVRKTSKKERKQGYQNKCSKIHYYPNGQLAEKYLCYNYSQLANEFTRAPVIISHQQWNEDGKLIYECK